MKKIYLLIFLTGFIFYNKPVYPFLKVNIYNPIDVEVISVEDLKEVIKNRNGKPLLINVWATWCAPCREEFPDLVKIAEVYKEKIDVIAISVDFPEEIDSKIIPFLKKQNASFSNYVIKVVEPEDFINFLNLEWSGAIPATFIYDEKGKQVKHLIGMQSFTEFKKVIENF